MHSWLDDLMLHSVQLLQSVSSYPLQLKTVQLMSSLENKEEGLLLSLLKHYNQLQEVCSPSRRLRKVILDLHNLYIHTL